MSGLSLTVLKLPTKNSEHPFCLLSGEYWTQSVADGSSAFTLLEKNVLMKSEETNMCVHPHSV